LRPMARIYSDRLGGVGTVREDVSASGSGVFLWPALKVSKFTGAVPQP
jgi:hypothetical protein